MKDPIYFTFIVITTLSWNIIKGQSDPVYTTLTTKDGLPSDEVYCLQQDNDGAMWIGTDRGLVKYDGYEMKTFTTRDGLPDNTILRSYLDYKGRVWFSTIVGGVFFIENDSIKVPSFNNEIQRYSKTIRRRFIVSIIVDSTETVYLSFNKGVNGFLKTRVADSNVTFNEIREPSIKNGSLFFVKLDSNLVAYGIYEKWVSNQSRSWNSRVEVNDSIYSVDHKAIKNYSSTTRFTPITNNNKLISEYAIDNFIYPSSSNQPIKLNHTINQIIELSNYRYVCTENGGLHRINRNSTVADPFPILNGLSISSLYIDSENVYWIGTVGNGIVVLTSFKSKVYQISNAYPKLKYRGSLNCSNDTLRIIYKNSLSTFLINDSLDLVLDQRIDSLEDRIPRVDWINNKNFFAATQSLEKIVLGNYTIGAKKIKVNQIIEFKIRSKPPALINIKSISPKVFLLRNNGLIEFDKNSSQESKINYSFNDAELNLQTHYFFGSNSGLLVKSNNNFTHLGNIYPQLNFEIPLLENDPHGNTFISIKGEGLGIAYRDTILFYNDTNGLSSNFVHKVQFVDSIAWVATNSGLNQLKLSDNGEYKVINYIGSNFLGFDFIDDLLINKGKPVLINKNHLIIVDPEMFDLNIGKDVEIKSLYVNGESHNIEFYDHKFPHDQNSVQIKYGLKSLHQSGTVFKYRLKGLFEDWVTTHERFALFPKLPAGNYQFQVKASNAYGNWSEVSTITSFRILPHFTQTVWFQMLTAILIIVTISIGTRWYIRFQRKKAHQEQRLLISGIRALKRQINPHFIFNAMNSVQYLVLTSEPLKANAYIGKLSELIRNIVYSTDRKRVCITSEIERINDFVDLELLRYKGQFEWVIEIQKDLILNKIFIPPMLIQPLVENAIKHGLPKDKLGLIFLKISKSDDHAVIIVEDNGDGFDLEDITFDKSKESIGLANIFERIDLINKLESKATTIEIINKSRIMDIHDSGSRIILRIEQ